LLILAAVARRGDQHFRLIKYSQFPPLSLMTIAGLTPESWDIAVWDEHVESAEPEGDADLVGIQTHISSARRAYELAERWRRRGANVVLGGLHPTSLPHEAAEHADAVYIGPAETVWGRILDDTCHAVFRPRRMTPEQLEAGYTQARRQLAACSSILRRSLGLPGVIKRIVYNVAWMKIDPLWVALIRAGLMPFATRILEQVLRLDARAPTGECAAVPRRPNASLPGRTAQANALY
jgi:hypothetical protein